MYQQRVTINTSETDRKAFDAGRREFLKRAVLLAGGTTLHFGTLTHAATHGAELMLSRPRLRSIPEPVSLSEQRPGGEMLERLRRNMGRLESELYDTAHVFHTTDSGDPWPGDTEGRLVLGVILEAQALQQSPKYLDEILRLFPAKLNTRGLFGKERPEGMFDEQLLASHGWVLRALSEYHCWQKDSRCPDWMNRMLDSLALPLRGKILATYPLNPAQRKHNGGATGHLNQQINGWKVSSDTGCVFIFLDGLVQAVSLLGRKDLMPVVEELKELMLRTDLADIKAQTHASLTGLRALCRLYEQDRSASLLRAIQDRWLLYRNTATTVNGENYCWFRRPEWTEPCAVVDSFLVAVNLWRYTRDPVYLEDAHHIYFNGLAAEQRANGGFGLNTCTHAAAPVLRMHTPEATWCCTMRGGEGLARAAQFSLFADDEGVLVAFPRDGEAVVRQGRQFIKLKQTTGYPQEGWVKLEVLETSNHFTGKLKLFSPEWTSDASVKLNGREIKTVTSEGFLVLSEQLKKSDRVDWTFRQPLRVMPSSSDSVAIHQGPLLFGVKGSGLPIPLRIASLPAQNSSAASFEIEGKTFASVYHLMDPAAEKKEYACQVLFRGGTQKSGKTAG